jgi:type I restriction enzyme S subunit
MESVIPKGYRQTDVGPIPTDWDVKKLGDIFTIGHGKSQHLIACDYGAYPILGTGGRMGLTNHFLYDKPSVLIGRKGTLDKPQYIDMPFWTIDTLFFTRFNSNYFPKYIFFVAQTIKWSSYSEASGVPSLTGNIIERIQISIPPTLAEQTNIAIALSDMDALIQNTEMLIVKKKDLKQATMQQLLRGKTRLPGFNGKWEVKRLGEFTDCTAGGTPSTRIADYWGGNIRWMNSGELNYKMVHEVEGRITEAGLRNSSTKMIPSECVLIGLAGQGKTRATVAMNFVPLCTNQSIAAIFPNSSFLSKYLYYNLDARYDELRELSAGDGGRGGLNLSIIKALPVPFPNLLEQTAIAEVLSDLDVEITALERDFQKYRDMKQGMMQELLTGRTRLPKEVING